MPKTLRGLVSKRKKRFQEGGFDLDLSYISNRIIAMGFPAEKLEGVYRNRIDDVVRFLQTRHPNHYKIYHLCDERNFDVGRFAGPVAKYPFRDHSAPQFEQIIELCADVKDFLMQDPENIVAINCKAGKGRTGLMVCACLLHLGLASNAADALRFYAEKRTDDGKGVTIPSQCRYVHYYETLLRSNLMYTRTPLYLSEVCIKGLHVQQGSVVGLKVQNRSANGPSVHHSVCDNGPATHPDTTDGLHCGITTSNLTCGSMKDASPLHSEDALVDHQMFEHLPDPLITITTLSSVPVHGDKVYLRAEPNVLVSGDVCINVSLKQSVLSKKICRIWLNTFFVANFTSNTSNMNYLPSSIDMQSSYQHNSQPTIRVNDNRTRQTGKPVKEFRIPQSDSSTNTVSVDQASQPNGLHPAYDTCVPNFRGRTYSHPNITPLSGSLSHSSRTEQAYGASLTAISPPADMAARKEITLELRRSELDKVNKSGSKKLLSRDCTVTFVFHPPPVSHAMHATSPELPGTRSPKTVSLSKGGFASFAASLNLHVALPFTHTRSLRLPLRPKESSLVRQMDLTSLSDLDEPSGQPGGPTVISDSQRSARPLMDATVPTEMATDTMNDSSSEDTDEDHDSETDSDVQGECVDDVQLSSSPKMARSFEIVRDSQTVSAGSGINRQSRSLIHFGRSPHSKHTPTITGTTIKSDSCSTPPQLIHPYTSNPVKHYFIKRPGMNDPRM